MERCKWERGVFVFAFLSDRLMLCFIASRTRLQLDLQTWETVNIYTLAHKSIRPTSMRKEKKKNCLTFSLAEKTRYKQMMQSLSPLFASWEPAPTVCFQFALPQKCQVNFFPVWWNCWNAGIVRNMLAVAVSSHLVLFYSTIPSVCVSFSFFSLDKSDRALPNTLALTQTTPVVLMKREHQLSDGCRINSLERCQFGQFHCWQLRGFPVRNTRSRKAQFEMLWWKHTKRWFKESASVGALA